jgi:integrase
MASRPRSRAHRDWPRGLRESKPGYFVWDNPITGKGMAIGRVPLADAKMQAIEANVWAAKQAAAPRLVDRLEGRTLTLEQWLTDWVDRLEAKGDRAKNTIKAYRSLARAVAGEIGAVPVGRLTVKDVAEALEDIEEERGERTAQAARSMLKTALTAAMAKGHIGFNPALSTEAITVTVKRQRFTWETFSEVWKQLAQAPAWLRNAAALALVTGQRREDIAAAAFSDFDDDLWRLTQEKSGHKLAIPLDLRLDVFGMSLRDVLTACRRTGVVSRHLIHQVRPYGNSPVGSPIFVDTLTKRFTEAVEAALGPGDNLPTLHELRSLCKRLYEAQGGVDTKTLLGHSTERMSELYQDARGAEFERVKLR